MNPQVPQSRSIKTSRVCVGSLTKVFTTEHVVDAPRGAHHDVGCLRLKLADFSTHIGPTDAGVATSTHVVAEGENHLLDLMATIGFRMSKLRLNRG